MDEVGERSLDSDIWHAAAGDMVQMPPVNSNVFYFPQGHAEHTLTTVDFGDLPDVPPMILCRTTAVKYLADPVTDEVYAKMRLIPVGKNELVLDEDGVPPNIQKPTSFAKTLTPSDANNGGGFSVPRHCAETIFPRLDFTADDTPSQDVIARDVHGKTWTFRHIYRGTPRRHLLTTGWSKFVNEKKLVAGDSIIFLRAENGDLCVAIRRAKRTGFGNNPLSGWNLGGAGNNGFLSFLKYDESKIGDGNLRDKGKVRPESVVEATFLAAKGQPFEVVYYPRASTPEFCIRASSVNAAMRVHLCAGMRFKMPFETEDSLRISWFTGTIASVKVVDPLHWPNSPWRLLQVTWDESKQLQNVRCVSPWLVEMVSSLPTILHLPPFSPSRKKLRLAQHPDFSLDCQYPMPSFSGTPLDPSSSLCLSDSITAGIQGARHAEMGISLPDLPLSNKLQIPPSFLQLDPLAKIPNWMTMSHMDCNESISCLLSLGNGTQKSEKTDNVKTPQFVLFGQPILTEQQMSSDCSSDVPFKITEGKMSSGVSCGHNASDLSLGTGHCMVFLESENVGQILDLSLLGSYEDLYKKLEDIFGVKRSEMPRHVYYHDVAGAVKQAGDEPFSEFTKTAKRLTIHMKASNNSTDWKFITGLPTGKRGLDSSEGEGCFSIFV